MASEIDRISTATSFNGIKLLSGSVSVAGTAGSWTENNSWTSEEGVYTNSSGWKTTNGTTKDGNINGGVKIHFGIGNNRSEDYYFVRVGDMRSDSLGIGADDVAVSTQGSAQLALNKIKTAILRKENARTSLGATQNRLENTITNLSIQAENLQSAESRISDVDMADEMTNFVKNQVLSQAGVAMLSQANSLPQMAMQLLG